MPPVRAHPLALPLCDSHAHLRTAATPLGGGGCCADPSRRRGGGSPSAEPSSAAPAISDANDGCSSGQQQHGQQRRRPVAPSPFLSPPCVVVCGTHPALDWAAVAALDESQSHHHHPHQQQRGRRVIVGFGFHPWYLPELSAAAAEAAAAGSGATDTTHARPATLDTTRDATDTHTNDNTDTTPTPTPTDLLLSLEDQLIAHPRAIVGEIGLDCLRGPSRAAQEFFFLSQLRLAAKHNRPVSVHCVRRYGRLLELLDRTLVYREDVPPAIILHGFTGSCEVARSLLRLKSKRVSREGGEGCGAAAMEGSSSSGSSSNINISDNGSSNHRRASGNRRGSGVKIDERIFFGIGAATSLRVKDCHAATLPLLLYGTGKAGGRIKGLFGCSSGGSRVLAETDRFYSPEYLRALTSGELADPARHTHTTSSSFDGGGGRDNEGSDAEEDDDDAVVVAVPPPEAQAVDGMLAPVLEAVAAAIMASCDTATTGDGGDSLAAAAAVLDDTFRRAFAAVLCNDDGRME